MTRTLLFRHLFPIPDENFYPIPDGATSYAYRRLVDGPAIDFWKIDEVDDAQSGWGVGWVLGGLAHRIKPEGEKWRWIAQSQDLTQPPRDFGLLSNEAFLALRSLVRSSWS